MGIVENTRRWPFTIYSLTDRGRRLLDIADEWASARLFMGLAFESHGPDARDRVERDILAGVTQEVGR